MTPAEKVTKVCNPDGQWFHHPESNRVWSNYTQCQAYTKGKLKVPSPPGPTLPRDVWGCSPDGRSGVLWIDPG